MRGISKNNDGARLPGRRHVGEARLGYTMPCAIMASATFLKPAMLAPAT